MLWRNMVINMLVSVHIAGKDKNLPTLFYFCAVVAIRLLTKRQILNPFANFLPRAIRVIVINRIQFHFNHEQSCFNEFTNFRRDKFADFLGSSTIKILGSCKRKRVWLPRLFGHMRQGFFNFSSSWRFAHNAFLSYQRWRGQVLFLLLLRWATLDMNPQLQPKRSSPNIVSLLSFALLEIVLSCCPCIELPLTAAHYNVSLPTSIRYFLPKRHICPGAVIFYWRLFFALL